MNMETIPVVVFLANGSQVTGYFRNKSTSAPSSPTQGTKSPVASVADLRQFIDTASGQDTQSYQLLMISPSHKPLDDPEELLCPSSVVQVPVEKEKKKKKVNFDSDAEVHPLNSCASHIHSFNRMVLHFTEEELVQECHYLVDLTMIK
eukprot:Phypoly_transcript_14441.p2 GENE.Phypoly_transcript_14441~~Phypoly_transcript_14441.p2  ORF type:complete len:148 (+),score=23.34 Phypoly_transcript_14441:105-548(+)